ncbi:MAG: thiamine diphosphokinase [Treponema sp.]|nr:thiamine diphosphokinase [Treponema sp.]
MKRCVIVSAGQIENFRLVQNQLLEDDFFIFCDGGLSYASALGVVPDIVVGDFDSCDEKLLAEYEGKSQIIKLPRVKDDTDTFYAVKYALKLGFDSFLLLGSMGARFDHALGNVSILLFLFKHGKNAILIDDYSKMQIVGEKSVFIPNDCAYFSLITIAGDVSGVTIKNAKYLLQDASLSCDFQLGISNEVLPGKTAEVSVKDGNILLVEVFK